MCFIKLGFATGTTFLKGRVGHDIRSPSHSLTYQLGLPVAVPHVLELAPDARGEHHGQERARHDVQQRRLRGVHQEQRDERRHKTKRVD